MTENDSGSDGDQSRRSFVRDGALASGGLALGLSAAGTAAAQQNETDAASGDDTAGSGLEEANGLIFAGNFHPGARFAVVSDVVEWIPNYGGVRGVQFVDYNTYMIRWQNTGNVVPLWVAEAADVGQYDGNLGYIADNQAKQQPQFFEMDREYTPLGDNPQLVTVRFSPVPEEDQARVAASEDWWNEPGNETDG